MTLSGDIDPVKAVSKLRKWCQTEIVSIEPLKEEKKESTNTNELISLNSFETIHFIIRWPHHNIFEITTMFDVHNKKSIWLLLFSLLFLLFPVKIAERELTHACAFSMWVNSRRCIFQSELTHVGREWKKTDGRRTILKASRWLG